MRRLAGAGGRRQRTLERRRRNLDESIGNFGERTHDYGTELQELYVEYIIVVALKARLIIERQTRESDKSRIKI